MEDIQYSKGTVVIGAGGLGRELVSFINNSRSHSTVPEVIGFIDDDRDSLNNFDIDLKVIDSLTDTELNNYEHVLLAINNSDIKRNIFSRIDHSKIQGFMHHSSIVGDRAVLHKSTILAPNVIVSCDCEVLQGVFINCGSQIGHDVFIDEFVNIMANVDIGGNCKIGKNVLIGTGSVIYPGVKIADNSVIGAGSVVFRNIKETGTYVGNPAKRIL